MHTGDLGPSVPRKNKGKSKAKANADNLEGMLKVCAIICNILL